MSAPYLPPVSGSSGRMTIRRASTDSTFPLRPASTAAPESRATTDSIPVPTKGGSVRSSGTACRCMLDPMSARLASSCSRNGMSDAATETSWFGETSMRVTSEERTIANSPSFRAITTSRWNLPARAKGRHTALVRDFGQRIGLVHELGQLGGPEELLDDRGDGFRVDQVVRHQGLDVLEAHLLPDRPFHAHQPHPELVLDQLPHGADAPVPEVVDVVRLADPVLQVDEVPDCPKDVLVPQNGRVQVAVRDPELVVQLEPSYFRQAVTLRVEEHVLEQGNRGLLRGGIPRPHLLVDFLQGLVPLLDSVGHQPFPDRPVRVFQGENRTGGDPLFPDEGERFLRYLLSALEDDLPGPRIRNIGDAHLLEEVVEGKRDLPERDVGKPLRPFFRDLDSLLERDLVRLGMPDLHGHLEPDHEIGAEHLGIPVPFDRHLLDLVEPPQELLRGHPDRPQKDGNGEFPLPVDLHVQHVLVIELEIQPGAAIRDDPRGEEDLAGGVGPSLVVLEEDAGRAMQLAHDDPFRPVDDEGRAGRHEGDFAEEHLLFLDVPDGAGGGLLVHIEDDELDRHLDRGRVVHPPFAAFLLAPFRLPDGVGNELQRRPAVVIRDGEDALEDGLQADVLPFLGRGDHLQEFVVRFLLRLDEIRYFNDLSDLGKVDPLDQIPVIQIRHVLTPDVLAKVYVPGAGNAPRCPCAGRVLFDFRLAPRLFDLLLQRLGFLLFDPFLDRLRNPLDEVLRLLPAQPRYLADHLDHLDLLVRKIGQDHVEVRFLLGRGARRTGCGGRHRHRGGRRRDAEPLLESLDVLVELENREPLHHLQEFLFRHRCHVRFLPFYQALPCLDFRSWMDCSAQTSFLFGPESACASLVMGDAIPPTSRERRTSLLGTSASASISFADNTFPSRYPAFSRIFWFPTENSRIAFASVTGSLIVVPMAVGPMKNSSSRENPESFAALRIRVFFTTLNSASTSRSLFRRLVISATVRPRYSASTVSFWPAMMPRIASTVSALLLFFTSFRPPSLVCA